MRLRPISLPFFLALPLFPQALATVDGKVVNSISHAPIKKAVVEFRGGAPMQSFVTVTDAEGKFHLDSIPSGRFTASASADGFANASGARPKIFTVDGQQPVSGAEIALAPLSVIVGKVTDDEDQPIQGANVILMRYFFQGSNKTLQTNNSAQTDDRGEFRMFDVQPGRYFIVASAPRFGTAPAFNIEHSERVHSTVPEEAYAPVFYPGVPEISQTSAHEIKPGDQWTGANFRLRRSSAFHIRGSAPASAGRGGLRAQPCGFGSSASIVGMGAQRRANGTFDVAGLTPGVYCLELMQPPGNVAARRAVTITNADVDGVVLTPETPVSVKGAVAFDGPPLTTPPQMINIAMRGADDNVQSRATVQSDNTFLINNIFPGSYNIEAGFGGALYIKSMEYGGQDVSSGVIPNVQAGASLNILLGTDPGEIDGTVQLGGLQQGTQIWIVALPDDAHAARDEMFRTTTATVEGAFTIQAMTPGDYRVFALELPPTESAGDRDLLKALEGRATPITVHPAAHEQTSLVPIPVEEIEHAREKIR